MVPNPSDHLCYGDEMPLSLVESAYQAIQSATPSTPSLGDLSPYPFQFIFPMDEMIMFVMEDTPWDDGHHCSILFLEQHTIESYQWILTPSTIVVISTIPKSTHDVFSKGNLRNISPTIPLNISKMCISELRVPLKKSSPTSHFSKNFVMSSPGAMKKYRVLTLTL
jgi:hypothetical protein